MNGAGGSGRGKNEKIFGNFCLGKRRLPKCKPHTVYIYDDLKENGDIK